jgi:hypothetical protein
MELKRNHCAKCVFVLFFPFLILLFSHSSVCGDWTSAYAEWTSVTPPTVSETWWLKAVHFTSPDEGWAVGWNATYKTGALLHYQNGTWTSVAPPTVSWDYGLTAVNFTSPDEGWAVGWDATNTTGVLLHYQNGTWTSFAPPTVSGDYVLAAVNFTSATEGWAVGPDRNRGVGVLLHYQNGIWTSVTPPTVSETWYLCGVHFTSPDEGWAVGWDATNTTGVLLHYQNGTWTSFAPPTVSGTWYLYGVHFTSANEGWAVGGDNANTTGALLYYQNGIWTSVTPPTVSGTWYLYGVHFTSANEGWAVGYDQNSGGILLHYQNGTWTSVTPPTGGNWALYGVHFTSATEGWAVGDGNSSPRAGALLHYSLNSTLTVIKMGAGSGTVISDPPGIDCGINCTSQWVRFAVGVPIALTATPESGSAFAYWSDGCAGTDGICTITMTDDVTATAHFVTADTKKYKLKVKKKKKNGGDGSVTSNDGNITCGDTCSYSYYKDMVVTLSAEANETSTFIGWKPANLNCIGTDSCTVSIEKAKTVQAIFVGDYTLKVVSQSKKGGSGTVISIPMGISCSTGNAADCAASYGYGEEVTLSASADAGSTFLGWSPAKLCPGTGDCIVGMDKKRTVKAVFSGP